MKIPYSQLRHHMILPPDVDAGVKNVSDEFIMRDRLSHQGLSYNKRILFHGPAGCGKSLAVERVGFETGLEFIREEISYARKSLVYPTEGYCNALKSNALLHLDISIPTYAAAKENDILDAAASWLDYLAKGELPGLVIVTSNVGFVLNAARNLEVFDNTIAFPLPGEKEIRTLLEYTMMGKSFSYEIGWSIVIPLFVKYRFTYRQLLSFIENIMKKRVLAKEEEEKPITTQDILLLMQEAGLKVDQ